jgi:hypothetical protein
MPPERLTVQAGVLAATLLVSACGEGAKARAQRTAAVVPYGTAYLAPALQGVALGISWDSLRRVRPLVAADSGNTHHGIWAEHIWEADSTDSTMYQYYFARPERPDSLRAQPFVPGALAAVMQMPRAWPAGDTAGYGQALQAQLRQWRVDPARPSFHVSCRDPRCPQCAEREVRGWRQPEVSVVLITWIRPPSDSVRPEMTAIIQSPAAPFIATWLADTTGDACRSMQG